MKAKQFYSIFFAVVLVLSFTSQVLAAEDLSDWEESIWQGNISLIPDGTILNVSADGSAGEAWRARHKYFSEAVGVMANVNVSGVSGNSSVGLRKYLGTTAAGTQILAEILLEQWDGKKRIYTRVRERDDQGNTIKQIAGGALGDWDGTWSPGQNISIALARIGDEIWFYTPGNGAFVKVMPFESMGTMESDVQIYGWAQEGATNSLNAVVSDVTILYADDLKVFADPKRAEMALVKAFITRFYQLCLDRDPDPAGLEGWTNDLLSQIRTGADVAKGFIFSPEFIGKGTVNADYLTILYKAFFNRDADPAGWDVWLSELNAGKDRGGVLDGFIYSTEFSNLCSEYGIKAF
jgi:hypothetical protein